MTLTSNAPIHATFSIERDYPQPIAKVFAAFSDVQTKRRWFAEGEGFAVREYAMDFREGGFEHCHFVAPDGSEGRNATVYLDIVSGARIVSAYTMDYAGARISSSLLTITFAAQDGGTRLTLTEQGFYLANSDGPAGREAGSRELLEALAQLLG